MLSFRERISRISSIIIQPKKMGLYVAVFMPEYGEWVRASAVTPTANQKDFTCTLIDYGVGIDMFITFIF